MEFSAQAFLDEKVQSELSLSKRLAELESHLILERNLKASFESQLNQVIAEQQGMKEKLDTCAGSQVDVKRLEMQLQLKEDDRNRLLEELGRMKTLAAEVKFKPGLLGN